MLSRVADSLFWFGRYVERAENYARFIEVNFNLSLDLPPGIKEQWEPLIAVSGDKTLYDTRYSQYNRESVIYFLTFDKEYENSILKSIEKARENARIIREQMSMAAWETLNGLYYYVQNAAKRKIWNKEDPTDFFESIRNRIHRLYGLAFCSEPRNEGWYFNKLGLYLERGDKTSRILDVKYHILLPSAEEVGTPLDYLHWAALLNSVGAYNAYKRVFGKISADSVVHYLLLDRYLPRSAFFCVKAVEDAVQNISGNTSGHLNDAERAIGTLRSELEFTDIDTIIQFGIHEYIDQLQVNLNNISIRIHEQYFSIKTNFAAQSNLL